jgi:Putative beta-barrel porin-2, OmpL-like. bbp2
VQMLDIVAIYKTSEKHSFAFNGDYASAKSLETGGNSGNFSGWSFYSNHKLSDSRDFSLRYSLFHDKDGLRGVGGTIGSLTGTYNIRTGENSLLRFEIRNDFANQSIFAEGAGFNDKHTTLTIAHTIRF